MIFKELAKSSLKLKPPHDRSVYINLHGTKGIKVNFMLMIIGNQYLVFVIISWFYLDFIRNPYALYFTY